jgi:hypothetical protein
MGLTTLTMLTGGWSRRSGWSALWRTHPPNATKPPKVRETLKERVFVAAAINEAAYSDNSSTNHVRLYDPHLLHLSTIPWIFWRGTPTTR